MDDDSSSDEDRLHIFQEEFAADDAAWTVLFESSSSEEEELRVGANALNVVNTNTVIRNNNNQGHQNQATTGSLLKQSTVLQWNAQHRMDPPLQQRVNADAPFDPMETVNASKLINWKQRINYKEEEIRSKEQQVNNKQRQLDHFEQTTEESNQSLRQLLSLKDELLSLEREQKSLKDELSALERSYSGGRYFAPLFDYWRVAAQTIEKNQVLSGIRWTNFWRTAEEADSIQVRQYSHQTKTDPPHPYTDTRIGATDTSASTAASGSTSRTSQSSQNSPPLRDMVWPRDIFGNDLNVGQDIAHLLPVGQTHKEWMHIAASVVGLDKYGTPSDWKKAVRGHIKDEKKSTKRAPGSGVVHFVSNKIRMSNQGRVFDGDSPKVILIPTMSLESAKAWKGEAYTALFAAGLPNKSGSKEDTDVPSLYRAVGLISPDAVYNGTIRDASAIEIEKARGTLTHAVLAVRDYLRNTTASDRIREFRIGDTYVRRVTDSHEYANEAECLLPEPDEENQNRKPLCLVEFGSVVDEDKHPAPDPLLLAYKAAAIWGMVTKKRLMSNGEARDPSADISEDDYLAELAFLEARSGFKRPQTWEELAIGLGQPNGYQASRRKVI
ncbi:hypothetical protein IV203_034229 [Nitzschia inconspicua]|uniref:Uncharacterized protein n=1 Tax=Nitzschia inconspicua TaxID=303405 RepID=A0A9K3M4B4_9STRA|nr:hypothetical protein IV203_034229 [Nitzschia inconspicua]